MNLLLSALLCTIALQEAFGCSPTPDWVAKTTAEQTEEASIVAHGVVGAHTGQNSVMLEVATIFKGCTPASMVVNGFRSSAACGVDRPALGAEIIVFVIRDVNNTGQYSLNDIDIHTGAEQATVENLDEVMDVTGDGVGPGECQGPGTGGTGTGSPGTGGPGTGGPGTGGPGTGGPGTGGPGTGGPGDGDSEGEDGDTERNDFCPERPSAGEDCDTQVTCRYKRECCDGSKAKVECVCRGGTWRCPNTCKVDCRCCGGEAGSCGNDGEEECCADGTYSCPSANGESTCIDSSNLVADEDENEFLCYPDPQCRAESVCLMSRDDCCERFEDGSTEGSRQCLPCLES